MARPQIEQQGAAQPQGIDAIVVIETSVFHGDEGGGEIGRHVFQFQPLADDGAAMADFGAVRVQEGEGQRPVDGIQVHAGIKLGREQAQ